MHGREIGACSDAAACLPWEEIALEALLPAGCLGAAGAVWGQKFRKVLRNCRAGMHGREIGACSDAAACLPCEEIALEALLPAGCLGAAGAVWGQKFRKVLRNCCAGMHGREIGACSDAAACLPWEEIALEALTAFTLVFARFERQLFFFLLEGGIGCQARVWRRMRSAVSGLTGRYSQDQSCFPPKHDFRGEPHMNGGLCFHFM